MTHTAVEVEERDRDYDKWLVLAAFIVFLISTTLILDEGLVFRSKSKGVGPSVAQMTKVSNDVRRRAIGDLAYFPARDLDEIYLGDSIFTGTGSGSQINFKSGSNITLNPETMVVIESDGNNSSLDVQKGSLSANLSKNGALVVNIGNEKTTLNGDNATLNLSKAADGSTQLNVEKGSLVISGPNGNTLLKENESANLKEGQRVKLEDHTLALINPSKNSNLWVQSTDTVNFKWQPHQNSKLYRITISSDENFSKILNQYTRDLPSIDFLAEGLPFRVPLYWKVEDLTTKASSFGQKFTLHRDDPPQLISPVQNKKIKLHELAQSPITLEWESWNSEKSFRVQVSKEITFNTLITDNEAQESHLEIRPSTFGNYYWRVKAINPNRPQSPWSKPRLILVAPGIQLSAPEVPNRYLRYQIDEG